MARRGMRLQSKKSTNLSSRAYLRREGKSANGDPHDLRRAYAARNAMNDYLSENPGLSAAETQCVMHYIASLPQYRATSML